MAGTSNGRLLGNFRKMVRKENVQRKGRRLPVAPTEQVRRFMVGEERWRVEEGHVTEAQYERYAARMMKKVEEMIDNGRII